MSSFCPEWIFAVCAAHASKDFLSSNNSITAISRKYATTCSGKYDEIKFEEILDLAENKLQFLSEIDAGEEAVNYINDYIHYRVKFTGNGAERKLSGMFSSAFNPVKLKEYSSDQCLKTFRATIFSIRNSALPNAPPGWLITDVEDIGWVGDMIQKETDLF